MWYTFFMERKFLKGHGKRKKKNRKKKGKALFSNLRVKTGIVILAILLASVVLANLIGYFKGYGGLGSAQAIPENDYNMRCIYQQGGRLYYEDDRYVSVSGVDVSAYQQEIDWQAVKEDGIDFAMIRLGYRGYEDGQLKLDSCYEYNVKEAKKAGLTTGVYFFSQATTPEEAIEEAHFVLRKIRGKKVDGPVGFDMEWIEGATRINDLTVEEKTAIADAFCQVIEEKGYAPIIYGNQPWLLKHIDLSYLTAYPVWLAHYSATTDYPNAYQIWQYTDSGQVDGIKGKVDLNLKFIPAG